MIKPQDKRKPERVTISLHPDIAEQLKKYAAELQSEVPYVASEIIAEYLSKLQKRGKNAQQSASEPAILRTTPAQSDTAAA